MIRCAYVVPPRIDPGVVPVGRPLPGSQVVVLTVQRGPAQGDAVAVAPVRGALISTVTGSALLLAAEPDA